MVLSKIYLKLIFFNSCWICKLYKNEFCNGRSWLKGFQSRKTALDVVTSCSWIVNTLQIRMIHDFLLQSQPRVIMSSLLTPITKSRAFPVISQAPACQLFSTGSLLDSRLPEHRVLSSNIAIHYASQPLFPPQPFQIPCNFTELPKVEYVYRNDKPKLNNSNL